MAPKKTNRKQTSSSGDKKKRLYLSQQGKVSDVINQSKDNNNKPEKKSNNMEVYHPHGIHKDRKILKDYIFEFIMLFLAITGGFFMENMRENIVERRKEKEYIFSLIRDIKEDTTKIQSIILNNKFQIQGINSVLKILERPLQTIKFDDVIEPTVKYLNNYNGFTPRDITMTQLKNSGGLRLIENKSVSDSIVDYYSTIENYNELSVKSNYRYVEDTYKLELEFFDLNPNMKNMKIDIADKNKIKELNNRGIGFKYNISWDNQWLNEVYKQGSSLLKLLEKEYDLND